MLGQGGGCQLHSLGDRRHADRASGYSDDGVPVHLFRDVLKYVCDGNARVAEDGHPIAESWVDDDVLAGRLLAQGWSPLMPAPSVRDTPCTWMSTYSATDTDAMYQYTDQGVLWQEQVRASMEPGSGGIKVALWRDAPYRDYRAAGR
jgi:hypothetical protein